LVFCKVSAISRRFASVFQAEGLKVLHIFSEEV